MLKIDKLCIEQLASSDEATRSRAAEELNAREQGHFEDHPLSRKWVIGLQPALLQAYYQTNNTLVRDWIMQAFADAQARGAEIEAIAKEALRDDCSYLVTLLYYISLDAHRYKECKDKIKALCHHPNEEVRWRCLYVLNELPLDYDSDSALLREMMLDSFYNTRTYAVLAFEKLKRIEAIDRQTLEEVKRIDDGAAKAYAIKLLTN